VLTEKELADFLKTAKLGELLARIREMKDENADDTQLEAIKDRIVNVMLERNLQADHREYWVMLDYIQEVGFEVTHLDTGSGDYSSTKVSIERKAADLVGSVWDERLYRQLSMMTEMSEYSYVIVTRDYAKLKYDLSKRGVNPQVLLGFIASMCAMGYPPLFIPDEYDASALIAKLIHKHEDDHNRLYSPRPKKATPEAYRNAIIESLPGVGYKLRRRLTKLFPTIESLVAAPVSELVKVDGIGAKMADRIFSALH